MREHARRTLGPVGGRYLAVLAVAGLASATLAGAESSAHSAPQASSRDDISEPPVVRALDVPASRAAKAKPTSDRHVVAALERTATDHYGLVAVTWRHGSAPDGTEVQVRSRVDGSWTPWTDLPVELDEGPGTGEEGDDVRDGTGPLWVGDGNGIAVRVSAPGGSRPQDVQVETIDPGTAPETTADDDGSNSTDLAPPGFPKMPNILTRAQWGADESLGDQCWKPIYGRTAKMVFVHHTVNSNNYSRGEAKAIVRAIHAYHTQSRGWCDIGYNFLIDKYGRVYQGRAGGIRLPVRGAHAGDYNTNTVGVSLIGNFEKVRPTKAMRNALVRFIGWRLGTSYVPVKGKVKVNGAKFNRIAGHRDADQTACPGKYVYRWLPRLRDRVAKYLSAYRSPIRDRASQMGRRTTGLVFRGEARQSGGRRTDFGNGVMYAKQGLGAHWLTGDMLSAYRNRHGTYGRFGFPRTDSQPTPVAGVRRVVLENGRLYRVAKGKVYSLWGRILIRYRSLGGVSGSLGLPRSNMMPIKIGRKANFANGSITWNRKNDTITVEYF